MKLSEVDQLRYVAEKIYDRYADVASGLTAGAGGCFYGDGKATLNAVQIPVELLEDLANALKKRIYGRTYTDRYLPEEAKKDA